MRRSIRLRPLLVLAIPIAVDVLAAGHLASEHVRISDAWSRELPPVSTNGAAYFTIASTGAVQVRIVGGRSPVARRVELHAHSMEQGVMRMRPVEGGLALPAGESVTLAPGGLHLMLVDLTAPLVSGEVFPLTVEFDDGSAVDVEVSVLSMEEAAKKEVATGHGGHGGTDRTHEKAGHDGGHGSKRHGSGG